MSNESVWGGLVFVAGSVAVTLTHLPQGGHGTGALTTQLTIVCALLALILLEVSDD